MATSELACTYAVSRRLGLFLALTMFRPRTHRTLSNNATDSPSLLQALILSDDGLEITADNILALTKAAKIEVEPYWPGLFAKLFTKKSVEDLISNIGSGEGAGAFRGGMHGGLTWPAMRSSLGFALGGCDLAGMPNL